MYMINKKNNNSKFISMPMSMPMPTKSVLSSSSYGGDNTNMMMDRSNNARRRTFYNQKNYNYSRTINLY